MQAHQNFSLQKRILDNHHRERPSPLPFPERGGSSADMLKTMAAALDEAAPQTDPEFEERYALLANRVAIGRTRRILWLAGPLLAALLI